MESDQRKISRHTFASYREVESEHINDLRKLEEEIERKRVELDKKITRDHAKHVRQLESDVEELRLQCDSLRADFERERAQLQSESDDLEPRMEDGIEEHAKELQRLKELHQKILMTKQDCVEKAQKELTIASADVAKVDARLESLHNRRKAKEKGKFVMQQTLEEAQRRLQTLQLRSKRELEELAREADEKAAITTEMLNEHRNELEMTTNELDGLDEKLHQQHLNLQQEVRDLEDEINNFEHHREVYKRSVEAELADARAQYVNIRGQEEQVVKDVKESGRRRVADKQKELMMQREQDLKVKAGLERRHLEVSARLRTLITKASAMDSKRQSKEKALDEKLDAVVQDRKKKFEEVLGEKKRSLDELKFRRVEQREKLAKQLEALTDKDNFLQKTFEEDVKGMDRAIERGKEIVAEVTQQIRDQDERFFKRAGQLMGEIGEAKLRADSAAEQAKSIGRSDDRDAAFLLEQIKALCEKIGQDTKEKEKVVESLEARLAQCEEEFKKQDSEIQRRVDDGAVTIKPELDELTAKEKGIKTEIDNLQQQMDQDAERFAEALMKLKTRQEQDAELHEMVALHDQLTTERTDHQNLIDTYQQKFDRALAAREKIVAQWEADTKEVMDAVLAVDDVGEKARQFKGRLEVKIDGLIQTVKSLNAELSRREGDHRRAIAAEQQKHKQTVAKIESLQKGRSGAYFQWPFPQSAGATSESNQGFQPSSRQSFQTIRQEEVLTADARPAGEMTNQVEEDDEYLLLMQELKMLQKSNDKLVRNLNIVDQKHLDLSKISQLSGDGWDNESIPDKPAIIAGEGSSPGLDELTISVLQSKAEKDDEIRTLQRTASQLSRGNEELRSTKAKLLGRRQKP